MRSIFFSLIAATFAACSPVYLDDQRHARGEEEEEEEEDDRRRNDRGDDDDDNAGDDDDDDNAGDDDDEEEEEPLPEEPAIGPDLGDISFSVTYDQQPTYIDRFSNTTNHLVEVCFDADQGGEISVVNVGDEVWTEYFEVAIGLYRWDDEEVVWSYDMLWSDVVLSPGENVYWDGPFCTTLEMISSDLDTVEYSILVLADAWNDVEEYDEENNLAYSDTIELIAMGESNNM